MILGILLMVVGVFGALTMTQDDWAISSRPQVVKLPIAIESVPDNKVSLVYYGVNDTKPTTRTVTVVDARDGKWNATDPGCFTLLYTNSDPSDPYTLVYLNFHNTTVTSGMTSSSGGIAMNSPISRGKMYYDIPYNEKLTEQNLIVTGPRDKLIDNGELGAVKGRRYVTGTFNSSYSFAGYYELNSQKKTYHIEDTRSGRVTAVYPCSSYNFGSYMRTHVEPFGEHANQVYKAAMMSERGYTGVSTSNNTTVADFYKFVSFEVLLYPAFETYFSINSGSDASHNLVFWSASTITTTTSTAVPYLVNSVLQNSEADSMSGDNPPSLFMLYHTNQKRTVSTTRESECNFYHAYADFNTHILLRKELSENPAYIPTMLGTGYVSFMIRQTEETRSAMVRYRESNNTVPLYPIKSKLTFKPFFIGDPNRAGAILSKDTYRRSEDTSKGLHGLIRVFPVVCIVDINVPSTGCSLDIKVEEEDYKVSVKGSGYLLEKQYYDLPISAFLSYSDPDEDMTNLNLPEISYTQEEPFSFEIAESTMRLNFFSLSLEGTTMFVGGSGTFGFSLPESESWIIPVYVVCVVAVVLINLTIILLSLKFLKKATNVTRDLLVEVTERSTTE